MSNDKMSNENCSHQKCQVTKCQMTAHLVGKSVVEMLNDKMSNDYSFSRKISCSHQKCQVKISTYLVQISVVVIRNVK